MIGAAKFPLMDFSLVAEWRVANAEKVHKSGNYLL
jgi:hypothetical protein